MPYYRLGRVKRIEDTYQRMCSRVLIPSQKSVEGGRIR